MVKRRTEAKIPKQATGPMPGTLNLLILKAASLGAMHGYGLLLRIERDLSKGAYAIEQGALYPALDRLVTRRWIKGGWQKSANNRKARYYVLTERGQKALKSGVADWKRTVEIMDTALACAHTAPVAPVTVKKTTAKKVKGKVKGKAKGKTKTKARARKAKKDTHPVHQAQVAPPTPPTPPASPVTAASAIEGYDPGPAYLGDLS